MAAQNRDSKVEPRCTMGAFELTPVDRCLPGAPRRSVAHRGAPLRSRAHTPGEWNKQSHELFRRSRTPGVRECLKIFHAKILAAGKRSTSDLKKRTHRFRQTLPATAFGRRARNRSVIHL